MCDVCCVFLSISELKEGLTKAGIACDCHWASLVERSSVSLAHLVQSLQEKSSPLWGTVLKRWLKAFHRDSLPSLLQSLLYLDSFSGEPHR